MSAAPSIQVHPLEAELARAQREGLRASLGRWVRFVGHQPGDVLELQVLNAREGRVRVAKVAHADSFAGAMALASTADGFDCSGVFIVGNRVDPAVATRAGCGQWIVQLKGASTSDRDIASRAMLFVDFDAKRPRDTSATNDQVAQTAALASSVYDELAQILDGDGALGYAHSGNGRGIYVALDGLSEADAAPLVRAALIAIKAKYETSNVEIDTSVSDAKRLVPCFGTLKKKGAPGIGERPHRRTAFVCARDIRRLRVEELRALVSSLRDGLDDTARAAVDRELGIKSPPRSSAPSSSGPPQPRADSPFEQAKRVPVADVLSWLGLLDGERPVCPGCGISDGSSVAIVGNGLKCSHNRCETKGYARGFRTTIDCVVEARRVDATQAVSLMAERFKFEGFGRDRHADSAQAEQSRPRPPLATFDDLIGPALLRAQRRADQLERPVPLPWQPLEAHFGGGVWPGLHSVCALTGVGKTTWALQLALHAAKRKIPSLYIGLELEGMQVALRLAGDEARVPWSAAYTGQAGAQRMERLAQAAEKLKGLPFHFEFGRPQGWPASELQRVLEEMRARYPESEPGSRPMLAIVDYLQLFGDEIRADGRPSGIELRERIGRAAYLGRELGARLNVALVVISSVARDKYKQLMDAASQVGLTYQVDDAGRPMKRSMRAPDTLVGLGKESGELEFASDSVSVLFKVPGATEGEGADVIFATAKGRATGATWSPLHFTGSRYEVAPDGGARIIEALESAKEKRARGRASRVEEKMDRALEDAIAVARYVLANDGCSVRAAREVAVGDTSRRWTAAKQILGDALTERKGLRNATALSFDINKAPAEVRSALGGNA